MPQGYSLHIGVNNVDQQHYLKGVEPLQGAENDARDLAQLASSLFGYAQSKVILGASAEAQKVLDLIQSYATILNPGDHFLLTYSGHGSALENPFYHPEGEDEEFDQVWCLYDRMLIDDELYGAFQKFSTGVKICVVSDSCHSGTITRDFFDLNPAEEEAILGMSLEDYMHSKGWRTKKMRTAVASHLYQEHEDFYKPIYAKAKEQIGQPVSANVRLFAACQDNQIAFDTAKNGLFTQAIKKIIAEEDYTKINREQFYQRLRDSFVYPEPNFFEYGQSMPSLDNMFPLAIDQSTKSDSVFTEPKVKKSDSPPPIKTEIKKDLDNGLNRSSTWQIRFSGENLNRQLINDLSLVAPIQIEEDSADFIVTYTLGNDDNVWNMAHQIEKKATQQDVSLRLTPIVPDHFPTQEENLTSKAAGSGSDYLIHWPPITSGATNFSLGWHLEDTHSQLVSARARVRSKITAEESSSNIRIAHIDTGWMPDHPTLKGNPAISSELAVSFVEDNNPHAIDIDTGSGQQWHGTGTLAILAGKKISKDDTIEQTVEEFGGIPFAEVVPIRISDSVLIFNADNFHKAILHAIETGCEVVTMSMGGMPSKKMIEAVNLAYENGITIVSAAGNCMVKGVTKIGPRTVVYPARFERVIAACGACHNQLPYDFAAQAKYGSRSKGLGSTKWMQGNWGPRAAMNTAIAAYTPNILWAEKTFVGNQAKYIVKKNGGGTSSATPQVAAAAALWILQHREELKEYRGTWKQVEAVRHALFTTAYKEAFKEHDENYSDINLQYYGNGILRANDALDIGVIEVNETMKSPAASSTDYGIKEALKLLLNRKQKSGGEVVIPHLKLLEIELEYHILQNSDAEELIQSLKGSTAQKQATQRLISILQQSDLSQALRNWLAQQEQIL